MTILILEVSPVNRERIGALVRELVENREALSRVQPTVDVEVPELLDFSGHGPLPGVCERADRPGDEIGSGAGFPDCLDGQAQVRDGGSGDPDGREAAQGLTRYESAGRSIRDLPEGPDSADPAVSDLHDNETTRDVVPSATIAARLRPWYARIVSRAPTAGDVSIRGRA